MQLALEQHLLSELAVVATRDAYLDSLTPDGFDRDFPLLLEPKLNHFRILLEEWRVSIYAQHLRTQQPVSEKRLNKYKPSFNLNVFPEETIKEDRSV